LGALPHKTGRQGDFPLISLACRPNLNPAFGLDFNFRFGMIFDVTTDFRPPPATHRQPDHWKTWLHGLLAMSPQEVLKGVSGMPTGTVKWFNTTKGFGFIAPDDGGKDVFVHISAVERAGLKGLNDNQKIGYELQSGRDGRASASDLRLL
jgi:CspA family cold shock protein